MARPSPAPWPSPDARWKRSNSRARSVSGLGVEPGQPQQVLDDLAQPLALTLNPAQRPLVLGRGARAGQRDVRHAADHAQRRPQLVRRVSGELQLPAAGLLDRAKGLEADGQRAEEHGHQQQRGRRDLAAQQDRLGMPVLGQALACDDPPASGAPGGEPERASPDDRGHRPACAGPQPTGERGGVRAERADVPAGTSQPEEERGIVDIAVIVTVPGRQDRDAGPGGFGSAGVSRAVSIRTGVADRARRIRCTTSRPEMPGIRQSSTATEYSYARRNRSAASPSGTTSTT
jgi:hypothetical protein